MKHRGQTPRPGKCVGFANPGRDPLLPYNIFTYVTSTTDDKRFSEVENRVIKILTYEDAVHSPEQHRLRSLDHRRFGSSDSFYLRAVGRHHPLSIRSIGYRSTSIWGRWINIGRDGRSVSAWNRRYIMTWDRRSTISWDHQTMVDEDRRTIIAWDRQGICA